MISLSENQNDYRGLGKSILDCDAGMRLDTYLGKYYLFRSRSKWAALIDKGEVLVNGQTQWRPAHRLKKGDCVTYFNPIEHEPEVDRGIQVLWEHEGIIAVYKPSGLPMHEAGAYRRNTFHQVLQETVGTNWAAIHRLDRETSGIVLCADSMSSRGSLCKGLRLREFKKVYLAVVFGVPEEETWLVDQPLGKLKPTETLFRNKMGVTPDGGASQTRFRLLEKTHSHALLRVEPITGRTHQIRIHAAWKGHHLVGDKKYFPNEQIYLHYLDHGFDDSIAEACYTERLCLHAHQITFRHPDVKDEITVVSPMPPDMQSVWDSLKKESLS